jgi:tetratricopeptide (TPR) repeat protein
LDAQNNKGLTLHRLKKYEEAIVCYDKALDIKPNHFQTSNNKSWTLCKLKRYEEALLLSEISLTMKQPKPEYVHTKGFILLKLKQYQDAIKWFDKALKIDPNHKDSIKDRQLAVDASKLDK